MKLYIMPGACSFVPHTALEWTGADYELEILDHETVKSEKYLRINPQGAVPAIVDGETVVTQNIAVQSYIDAKYPDATIFGDNVFNNNDSPAKRAELLHWLGYVNADVHKAFAPLFGANGFVADKSAQKDLKEHAKKNIINVLKFANTQLSKQDYLTGSKSTADIYLYVMLRWSKDFKLDLSAYENFNAFIKRIEEDAGVTEVIRQEGLEKIGAL